LISSESSARPGMTRPRNSCRLSLERQVSSYVGCQQRLEKGWSATYECVHRLIGGLPGLQTIVDLVCPRSHLYGSDELLLDHSFLVEVRKEGGNVVADEMGFSTRSRVECREGESSDGLQCDQQPVCRCNKYLPGVRQPSMRRNQAEEETKVGRRTTRYRRRYSGQQKRLLHGYRGWDP